VIVVERARRLKDAVPFVLVAALLALVPFSTCLSKRVVGVPCPLCGMTRACLALVRGDVSAACGYHPLVLPLVALCVAVVVVALLGSEATWRAFVRRAVTASAVAFVVVWLARFAGFFGGPVT